jgi:oligoribonuclease NrnB/cAMP/cGMP phosphodiesterase (DHH superfamily)
MADICFYHNADLDGHCSAAIVHKFNPKVELIGWNYGDSIPWDKIEAESKVWLVDISFKPDDMAQLADVAGDVVWIDHHISAVLSAPLVALSFDGVRAINEQSLEELRRRRPLLDPKGVEILRLGGRLEVVPSRNKTDAACLLTWRYFTNNGPPYVVSALSHWDSWKWIDFDERSKARVRALQFGLRSIDTENFLGDDSPWPPLLDKKPAYTEHIRKGEAIVKYQDEQSRILMKTAFETELDGHRVLAVNGTGGSTIFDSIVTNHPDCVALMPFHWSKGHWRVSLYSERIDCSKVAAAHGGGGHEGAAGFMCVKLPFTLR